MSTHPWHRKVLAACRLAVLGQHEASARVLLSVDVV